jgi:hypothetical protein
LVLNRLKVPGPVLVSEANPPKGAFELPVRTSKAAALSRLPLMKDPLFKTTSVQLSAG